jgi:hypothetical protein
VYLLQLTPVPFEPSSLYSPVATGLTVLLALGTFIILRLVDRVRSGNEALARLNLPASVRRSPGFILVRYLETGLYVAFLGYLASLAFLLTRLIGDIGDFYAGQSAAPLTDAVAVKTEIAARTAFALRYAHGLLLNVPIVASLLLLIGIIQISPPGLGLVGSLEAVYGSLARGERPRAAVLTQLLQDARKKSEQGDTSSAVIYSASALEGALSRTLGARSHASLESLAKEYKEGGGKNKEAQPPERAGVSSALQDALKVREKAAHPGATQVSKEEAQRMVGLTSDILRELNADPGDEDQARSESGDKRG